MAPFTGDADALVSVGVPFHGHPRRPCLPSGGVFLWLSERRCLWHIPVASGHVSPLSAATVFWEAYFFAGMWVSVGEVPSKKLSVFSPFGYRIGGDVRLIARDKGRGFPGIHGQTIKMGDKVAFKRVEVCHVGVK